MIKIIIVEDENIVRLGLSTILPWSEYCFELCGLFKNGQEALQYMLEHPVDIVITDIKMPVMSGDQLVQKLREHGVLIPEDITTVEEAKDGILRLLKSEKAKWSGGQIVGKAGNGE